MKLIRKIGTGLWLTLWAISLCASVDAAVGAKLVAASSSDRYHLSTCKIAGKIPAEELIVFKTPEEAATVGLVPCKKCNPPAVKKSPVKE